MAEIKPFRGILYNSKRLDMAKVVAPPYDVISGDLQDELYRRHQYNVVRLILGKIEPADTGADNRYTRAAGYLRDWLKKKILEKSPDNAFYVYEQVYLDKGKLKSRTGFIGLMRIEDPRTSKVLPHEYTFVGPKKDRLKLLNETRANLSPIFSLFEDENFYVTNLLKKAAKKIRPLIDIEADGVNHKLWKLKDKGCIKRIKSFMKTRAIFIADGHHRYEVALAFRDLMKKKKNRFKPSFDYTMVYFSNLSPEAITILSTHRVVKDIRGLAKNQLISRLGAFFEIRKYGSKEKVFGDLGKTKRIRFAVYAGKNIFYLLTLKDKKILDKLVCPGKSIQWKYLPVTVLHQLIFNRILKIKEKIAQEGNIVYTTDEDYAITLVDKRGYSIAFFLNPTEVEQFKDIARSRDRMPHKSTYFYPKLLSGLVIRKF